jgi:Big-like domain-containing protein
MTPLVWCARHSRARATTVVTASLVVAVATALGGALIPGTWTLEAEAGLIPIGVNDNYNATHDRPLIVPAPGVLKNDVDLLGGSTAVLVTTVAHGTLNLEASGGFTYTPAAGYVGPDSFVYHPSGLLATSATATITVTNAAPVAQNDAYAALTATELNVPAPGVMSNDHDADGDTIMATLVSGGGNGSLSFAANGGFTYTSGGSFVGTRTFTYNVSDGIAFSNTATVTITVSAPQATPTPTPTPAASPAAPPPTPRASLPLPTATLPLPTLPLPTPTLPLPTLPLPTPTLPLPTLPLPTLPLPTPTLPLPTAAPSPTPTPTPSSNPSASASVRPSASPSPRPSESEAPGGAGTTGPGGGPRGDDRFSVGGVDLGRDYGLVGAGFDGFGIGIEWAVPALALTVPGLLLILAILSQAVVGAIWLPFTRRWLGSFGVGRRKAEARTAA